MKITTFTRVFALSIGLAFVSSLNAETVQNGQQVTNGNTVTADKGSVATTSTNAKGDTTVASLSGKVTVKLADGKEITIDAGTGVVISATGFASQPASLAALVQSNPGFAASLVTAVADVAKTTASNSAALTQLALVVKVVAQAVPDQATTIVTNAVAALGTTGTVTGETLNQAVGAVIQATAQGSGATVASLTTAATTVPGVTVTPVTSAPVLNEVLAPVTPVETPVINIPASPS